MNSSTVQPIARRELELEKTGVVEVLVWPPEKRGKTEYRCEFQIRGLKKVISSYANGADSVQALFLAFEKIGIELYCSDEGKSGFLRWFGQENLGFPVPRGQEDLIP